MRSRGRVSDAAEDLGALLGAKTIRERSACHLLAEALHLFRNDHKPPPRSRLR